MNLKAKTALITGAGRGIGRAIALAFARQGCDLVVTARMAPPAESLREEVTRLGVECSFVIVDLVEAGAAAAVFDHVAAERKHVDILVNNAGVGSSIDQKSVVEFNDATWDLTLRLNLTVPYLLCKRFLPAMLERRYGRIINIGSIAGKFGLPQGVAYSASKHGLLGLTRTLALEVAGDGITVNAVCPGPTKTDMNQVRVENDAKRLGITVEELEKKLTPIGRRLMPDEIPPLVLYLASDEAAGVTGQAFNIDGGILTSA